MSKYKGRRDRDRSPAPSKSDPGDAVVAVGCAGSALLCLFVVGWIFEQVLWATCGRDVPFAVDVVGGLAMILIALKLLD